MPVPNTKSSSPMLMAPTGAHTYFRPSPSAASVAANDDGPRKWYEIRNPLWVIVIGMALLFAVMALIVAFG